MLSNLNLNKILEEKKIPFTVAPKRIKIPRNKLNQGGKRPVLQKL